jgi:hypothetical protein
LARVADPLCDTFTTLSTMKAIPYYVDYPVSTAMIWHAISLDVAHLEATARVELETRIARLREIPEVKWFHIGRDAEHPNMTVFICVFEDVAGLASYRISPIHVGAVEAILESRSPGHTFDLAGLPLPG